MITPTNVFSSYLDKLSVTLNRLLHDVVPDVCALPGLTSVGPWFKAPGKLATYEQPLQSVLKTDGVLTDFGRLCEQRYVQKWMPRNIFRAWKWEQLMESINWCPRSKDPGSSELLEGYMNDVGLVGRDEAHLCWDVDPPEGQTGLGIMYDPDVGEVITGKKSNYWTTIMSLARRLYEWAQLNDKILTWEHCDDQAVIDLVLDVSKAVYVPTVRLDRGWERLRLLFQGNGPVYVLEQMVSRDIKDDMRKSSSFGFYSSKIADIVTNWGQAEIVSGDLVVFDQHIPRKRLRKNWRAWQHSYGLPEFLMVMLYIINAYSPLARWFPTTKTDGDGKVIGLDNELRWQKRDGMNPSGSGAFVITNNLELLDELCSNYQRLGVSHEGKHTNFGDDHIAVLPEGVSLDDWISLFGAYGQNAEGSVKRKAECKFLRFLFKANSGFAYPITASRFRNIVCPEDSGITSRSKELNAITLRAQLAPYRVLLTRHGIYAETYKWLVNTLVKHDDLMLQYDDDVLAARLGRIIAGPHEICHVDALDSLFFVKRLYGLKDTTSVFK